MCYKVSTPKEEKLREYVEPLGLEVASYEHFYHADGFKMPYLPITASDAPKKIIPAMWKLIPHWVKTEADAKKYANTLNATCEDIFTKASYKSYISTNRCLLWVQGFFEPHHPSIKVTVPYYVHMKNDDPFTLGGVYSNWVNQETGEVIKTFSVITTEANTLMAEIHNEKKRMPLIIAPGDRDKWTGKLSKEEIEAMMVPLPDGDLEGYPVSNLVYKKGYNTNVPEIIMPV